MKLFFVPGACSLAAHIALREAALPFELVLVDVRRGKQLPDGSSYVDLVPKGYVPALGLDDGALLTEGAVILQYLADLRPESGLLPPAGSFARVRQQEMLHYVSTELHKGMTPLFQQPCPPEVAAATRERVAARLALVARHLEGRRTLFDGFTVADAYLFYVLRTWQRALRGEIPASLDAYYRALTDRPSIRAALAAEHLAA